MYLMSFLIFFFFNDTATTEIYTLSLHDALPIFHARYRSLPPGSSVQVEPTPDGGRAALIGVGGQTAVDIRFRERSEEHTSELQSRQYLVCRLLLEKKKNTNIIVQTRFH